MKKLEKEILKTLAFFDLSQKPLTFPEIWHFLHRTPASQVQVLIALENLEKNQKICKKNDQYFLPLRSSVLRADRYNETLQQTSWKKVERYANLFGYIPFLQNVSVTGSLAHGEASAESDINLLVIARKNRKWLTRTLLVMLLEAFGQNKNRWYRAGKFSVDFVLEEQDLDLTKLNFKKDAYTAYWLASLTPVLDRGGYKKLIAQNDWVLHEFPNWQPKEVDSRSSRYTAVEKFLMGDKGRRLIEFGKKIKIKSYLDFIRRKTHAAEEAFIKTSSRLKRKEFLEKWQKIAGLDKSSR